MKVRPVGRGALRAWLGRVVGTLSPRRSDRDLEDELQSHLELAAEDARRLGTAPADLAAAVRRRAGGGAQALEALRSQRELPSLRDLGRDAKYAVRVLWRAPLVTVVAVLSLALPIGANTAMFSLVDSLLLRALPVPQPERLALFVSSPVGNGTWTYALWQEIRDRHRDLYDSAFAFSATQPFNLAPTGKPDPVEGFYASADYFSGLGVAPMLGRVFTSADDARGGGPDGPVAIISHSLWQRRFGGKAEVLGQRQTIERVSFTIVGVTPPEFFGTEVGRAFDVVLPIGTEPLIRGDASAVDRTTTSWLYLMARLGDDQTLAMTEERLRAVQQRLREVSLPLDVTPEVRANQMSMPMAVHSAALGTSSMRTHYRLPILALLVVAALLLIIACANVANLLMARAAGRRHGVAVRMALGASRWRVARSPLIESLLLSVAGSVLGLVVAQWASHLLVRQVSTSARVAFLDLSLDWRVLAFTTLVTVVVTLLSGTMPAMYASRAEPIDAIRERGRGAASGRRNWSGAVVVTAQIALSVPLIVLAGLFGQTFASLATLDLGFDRDAVLLARMNVPSSSAVAVPPRTLYERIVEAVRQVPGVSDAAVSEITPISGSVVDHLVETEQGPQLLPPQNIAYRNVLTPGWFRVFGTPIRAGRAFEDSDQLSSTPVVIVNETFVRRFQLTHPLGRRLRLGAVGQQGPWLEIIGVAADAAYRSVREPIPPTLYLPLAQQKEDTNAWSMSVGARTAGNAFGSVAPDISEAIGSIDPDIAITFLPLGQQVSDTLVQERMLAMVSSVFGVVGPLLAGLGLYGIMWHSVNQRRNELGIRMVLGADPTNVVRLVLARALMIVVVGIAVGLALTAWAVGLITPLLFGSGARYSLTMGFAVAILATVALVAGWLPARGAARTDPVRALRDDA